jgi:hypothetical protein
MPPVRPAPHPAPKFTRRRLTFPDHDQFFYTGHRRRARARPARARGRMPRDAQARAMLLSPRRPRSQRRAIPLILFSVGLASHQIKATRGAVGPFLFLNGSQHLGATIHVHAYRRARYRPRLRPGRARYIIPRFVWNRDLFMILQTRKVDECRPLPAC